MRGTADEDHGALAVIGALMGYSSLPIDQGDARELLTEARDLAASGLADDAVLEQMRQRLRDRSETAWREKTIRPDGTPGLLDPATWRLVRTSVPVACVDVIPVRLRPGKTPQVGFITRETRGHGAKLTLIGGRVHLLEDHRTAMSRHVADSLGSDVRIVQPRTLAAGITLGQYFPTKRPGFPFDEDKNSISTTYPVFIQGKIKSRGEALAFTWFDIDRLPPKSAFGFDQDIVVRRVLRQLGWSDTARGLGIRQRDTGPPDTSPGAREVR